MYKHFWMIFFVVHSFFLGAASSAGPKELDRSGNVRILTWNVLGEYSDSFREYFSALLLQPNWKDIRYKSLVGEIEKHIPDVICLQEVSSEFFQYLDKHFKDVYRFKHCSRGRLVTREEFLAGRILEVSLPRDCRVSGIVLGYKADKFVRTSIINCLHAGYEKALWAYLTIKQSPDKMFSVVSVHLHRGRDPFGMDPNESISYHDKTSNYIKAIASEIDKQHFPEHALVLAGDFNTDYEELSSIALQEKFRMFKHDAATYGASSGYYRSIDHVLYRNMKVLSGVGNYVGTYKNPYRTAVLPKSNVMLDAHKSDHAPVVINFDIPVASSVLAPLSEPAALALHEDDRFAALHRGSQKDSRRDGRIKKQEESGVINRVEGSLKKDFGRFDKLLREEVAAAT